MSRSIARGFASVLGSKVVVLAVGIVTSPLLASLLGEADYGDYSFLLSVFSIFMIFVSSGVTDGVQKFLGEERADSSWDERVVGFYFRLAVLLGLVGAGAMVWFARSDLLFALVGDGRFRRYFTLLAGLVVAAQFRSYARRTLIGFGLEPYSESLKVLNRLTFVATGLALAWLGHGVAGVLVGHVVGSALSALIGFGLIARRVSVVESLRIAPRSFPRCELLSFNGLSVVLVALLMSLYHVDVMMIRVLVDGPATAFYKVALVLAEFLWVAPMALQTVLLRSASTLWSRGDRRQISQITARITRYSLLFTALLAVGIGSLAPIAVPMLWPDEYVASLVPLYLLLPGAVGFAVARPILGVGQAKGDLGRLIAATGAAALLNVVLNWVLISRYGMHGAAVATSSSYGSMFFLHVWSARGLGFDPLADARLLRVGVTVGVGAPLVVALSRTVGPPALTLAVVPVGGAVTFAALALVTGALDLVEVLEVASSLPVVGPWAASLKRQVEFSPGVDAVETFQRVLLVAGVALIVVGVSSAVTGVPVPVGEDGDGADVPLTTDAPALTETPTPDAPADGPTTSATTATDTATTESANATAAPTTAEESAPPGTGTASTTTDRADPNPPDDSDPDPPDDSDPNPDLDPDPTTTRESTSTETTTTTENDTTETTAELTTTSESTTETTTAVTNTTTGTTTETTTEATSTTTRRTTDTTAMTTTITSTTTVSETTTATATTATTTATATTTEAATTTTETPETTSETATPASTSEPTTANRTAETEQVGFPAVRLTM